MMNEIKNALDSIGVFDIFKGGFLIFIPTMANVYLWGKMLGIAKSDRVKNAIAFVTILAVTYYYCAIFYTYASVALMCWNLMIYASMSILLYVLVGFHLFSRMDSYLDRKFAPDTPEEAERKRKAREDKRNAAADKKKRSRQKTTTK